MAKTPEVPMTWALPSYGSLLALSIVLNGEGR